MAPRYGIQEKYLSVNMITVRQEMLIYISELSALQYITMTQHSLLIMVTIFKIVLVNRRKRHEKASKN